MEGPIKTIMQDKRVDQSVIDSFLSQAEKIVGTDSISVNQADLLANSYDYWPISSIWMLEGATSALPQVVVWPQNTGQVSGLLALASKLKVPVTPYGEGSGVLGGSVPLHGGIILDMKKMNKILNIDDKNLLVTVESGLNGVTYEEELSKAGFTGGHIPQSIQCSTVGGWLACRAAGQLSTRYGKIEDIVVSLEAVLPDGTIFRGKNVPRSSTGPRADHLFLGSEGCLGVITEATLRIWPCPEKRYMESYLFNDLGEALEAIRFIMRVGCRPAVVRLYDERETDNHFSALTKKGCALIFLSEGDPLIVEAEKNIIEKYVFKHGGVASGPEQVEYWLNKRFDISAASKILQRGAILDTIEVTTNWHNAYSTYKAMQEKIMAVEGTFQASGHYSHVYPEGAALYMTVVGFAPDKEEYYHAIWQAAMRGCLAEEASIAHHHGIGLQRAPWMAAEHRSGMEVLRKIKKSLDPHGIMNPGKLDLTKEKL